MNKMYSFTDLFAKPVDLDKSTQVILNKIIIPKIQRPYAQGRQDEKSQFVREKLLTEMFEAMQGDDVFTLNFVYGIVKQSGKEYIMELLDGQQRLTTLFLVHWYIVNRELQAGEETDTIVRNCLSRFLYETRSTSTVFCQKLSNYYVNLDNASPGEVISKAKWYFKSFDRDSTICAMLTMLDSIHEFYNKQTRRDLHTKLQNLKFYVKSLGYFNLSEELYIKMNARGLQLSSFENFKADLTNFVSASDYEEFKTPVPLYKEGSTDKVPFSLNFSIKLDAKWVDLFWKKGSEGFDASYMSFFSRFFAVKYIIDSSDSVTDRDMRSDETLKALYTDAEDKIGLNEYTGFKTFETMLEKNPRYIITLNDVLDVLHEHDCILGRRDIRREFTPLWDRVEGQQYDDFYCNARAKMTHVKLILLGAVIEFVDAYNTFDLDLFRSWMRVVWNIIENTNIDSLTPVSSLIRKMSSLIHHIARKAPELDFYSALSKYETDEKEMRTVVEEIEKARRISENADWLPLFQKAEVHTYFKGMVLFFYTKNISIEDYKHRLDNVELLFDENGIAPDFRKDHLLIRAIVACHTTWWDINELYVTERAEKNKYLKNILASQNKVREMLASISALSGKTEMVSALENHIATAPDIKAWDGASSEQLDAVLMASDRLHNDVKLYDWVFQEEISSKSCFRVYSYEGHIMFAAPRKQYAKVALDTERAKLAYLLYLNYGFSYSDIGQLSMYESFGDCYGNEIWLTKKRGKCTIWVGFKNHHILEIQIECLNRGYASTFQESFSDSVLIGETERTILLPLLTHTSVVNTQEQLNYWLELIFSEIPEETD